MRQVINLNTSDLGVMQLFGTALTTLQQQGDPQTPGLERRYRLVPVKLSAQL